MDEATRRLLGELTSRLYDLTHYIANFKQIDRTMRNNDRPGAIELRMEMFRIANAYIQDEWTEIKAKLDEIFDIRYGITILYLLETIII